MYKLVGADQKEYGPVSREMVLEWIAQGRANAQTIARFEDGAWKPLGTFDEFKPALSLPTAPPPISPADVPISQTVLMPAVGVNEPLPFSGIYSQRKSNVPAILGLITSVMCCCCWVGPILAFTLSAIGFSQIRSQPNIYSTPQAVPIAGMVLAFIMLILQIVGYMLDTKIQELLQRLAGNLA